MHYTTHEGNVGGRGPRQARSLTESFGCFGFVTSLSFALMQWHGAPTASAARFRPRIFLFYSMRSCNQPGPTYDRVVRRIEEFEGRPWKSSRMESTIS